MAIIEGGTTGALQEIDSTFKAARVSLRPLDYGTGGAYGMSMVTGVMAAGLAAGSEVFQFRYTGTNPIVINKIMCDGAGSIVAFAAGVTRFEVVVARAWSVDGSGGTAAVLTTNNNKLRASMPTSTLSTVGSIRVATTAALVAGTKTLDAQGIGAAVGSVPATAGAVVMPESGLFHPETNHPLILGQNEGFVIRATVPATGTWTAGFTVRWSEVASY